MAQIGSSPSEVDPDVKIVAGKLASRIAPGEESFRVMLERCSPELLGELVVEYAPELLESS